MDSQYTNNINYLCSNLKKYENKVNKNVKIFNKELNEIQKEINILNNLSLDLISLIISRDDIFANEAILRIILGYDFYNAIVNFVPTYNDIQDKVKEQLEIGKKYIIVGIGRFNEVFDTIYYLTELYTDVLFITFANAERFLRKKNIKSLQPTTIKFSEEYFKLLKKDYDDLYIDENKKLKIVGLYSSLDTTLTAKLFIDEFAKNAGIEIFWIEKENYNEKIWYDYLNNLDYYFEIIWLLFDPIFLNDKINIYYIKNYLYKAYFDTAILAYPLIVYRLQPFNNILSKGYFFDFNTTFKNPYFILKDIISSTLFKDQYQKLNLYYQQFTDFNNFLDNENKFKLYFANQIFTSYIPINNEQKKFIDFINLLSETSFKSFIRLDIQLQDILIENINNIKNKYISSIINSKCNFNENIIIKYNNTEYDLNFYGFFIQKYFISNEFNNPQSQIGDIIVNYNIPLTISSIIRGNLSDQVNNLNSLFSLRLSNTMFNLNFRKNLYFSTQNASLQLLNRSSDYFNYVNQEFNFMNRIIQNMLWFYIFSSQNLNFDESFFWTSFYIPQISYNMKFNIRLLFNIIDEQTNNNFYFGFENKLGNISDLTTISNNILNISNIDTFINKTFQENNQYDNIFLGSDFYDKNFNQKNNNNFNILIDLKKIYQTLNFLKINNIKNNNKLDSIMLSIYQEYLVKDEWLQNQIILNPKFNPLIDIPWNNILDNIGTIFEKNNKFYNIRYQMKDLNEIGYDSVKFWLWNNGEYFDFMRIFKTKFIDNQLVIDNNNNISVQYENLNSKTGLKELYLNNQNNVNSLDIDLYRKLYTNNSYNNFLYDIFSEENIDENWINSSNYFLNNLSK
jgi:hypothetical protein